MYDSVKKEIHIGLASLRDATSHEPGSFSICAGYFGVESSYTYSGYFSGRRLEKPKYPMVTSLKKISRAICFNLNILGTHEVYICTAGCLDATMPQFYVAIGFAMQLTLLRLREKKGIRAVFLKQLRRTRTLYVISLLLEGIDKQTSWAKLRDDWPKLFLQPIYGRSLFGTLNIIGLAQLVIVPVITRPVWIRVCYMFGSMAVYMLGQWAFFLKFQWENALDGGSFGAFSWAFPMLAGSLLNDWNEVSRYEFLFSKLVDSCGSKTLQWNIAIPSMIGTKNSPIPLKSLPRISVYLP